MKLLAIFIYHKTQKWAEQASAANQKKLVHAVLLLITYGRSYCLDEPAQVGSLARALTAGTHKVEK